MNEEILKEYVCTTPFTYMEAHRDAVYSCCPSWLPNKLSTLENIKDAWTGDTLNEIKKSIIDGNYKYCSKTQCPYLSSLLITKKIPQGFVKKENFNINKYKDGPQHINFAFDRSCNLSCPSCRTNLIMANGKEIEFIDEQIENICNLYGKTLTLFYLSGSSDPLASKSLRKFLINFDRNKFPKLKNIHLHTNGLLLDEKLWNSLSHIHDLIKTIEISIDASTSQTYSIVRRGGDWDVLMKNLQFISECNSIKKVRTSFVVQDTNYTEMENFYILMNKILKQKCEVFFGKITNWGTYSDGEFLLKQIWNENHPEYKVFLKELSKVCHNLLCVHNMHDIVEKHRLQKKLVKIL